MFSIYLAKARSIGSLKFRPMSCKLMGIPLVPSFMGIDTAGTPKKIMCDLSDLLFIKTHQPCWQAVCKNPGKRTDPCSSSV